MALRDKFDAKLPRVTSGFVTSRSHFHVVFHVFPESKPTASCSLSKPLESFSSYGPPDRYKTE